MIFSEHAKEATRNARRTHTGWMARPALDDATLDAVVRYLPGWAPTTHKAQAYGMVIFDAKGRVLLRRPTGHFGGAVWTFAKGRGTRPAATAKAELAEETGRAGAIYGLLPNAYEGTVTRTNYFLGRSTGYRASRMDDETEEARWMTYAEALAAIQESAPAVAARDTRVLHDAYNAMKETN